MGTIPERELHRLQRKEARFLRAAEEKKEGRLEQKRRELTEKIEEKIPEKLQQTLDTAFYKAFLLIFEKGTGVIEKTFNAEELRAEFRVNDFRVEQKPNKKALRQLDKVGKRSRLFHSCVTTVEGIGLGALGIGLPDIPIFLAMLLRSLYETAAGYGYDCKRREEQIFILRMITAALADGAEKRQADALVEAWLEPADSAEVRSFEEEVRVASGALSEAMLTAKFIQGLPIVGIAGGIGNPFLYRRVMQYAAMKYKKRYLMEKRKSV